MNSRPGGKDEEMALQMTIDSIGDIEQTVQEVANVSRLLERQVRINLTAIDLQKSDFAGVTMHTGKFKASPLRGADFAGAIMDKLTYAALSGLWVVDLSKVTFI